MAMTSAFWRFARGFAFAAKGQIATAEAERQILATARKETPADVECCDQTGGMPDGAGRISIGAGTQLRCQG